MKLKISNKITIDRAPAAFERAVMNRLTFENPAFVEAEERGRWTGKLDRFIECWDRDENGRLVVPRGFARQLCIMARRAGIPFEVVDRRRVLPDVDFRFTGKLRPFQVEAVEAVLSRDFGTLSAPTGSGKTCMALYCIAQRRQPALVVVHTRELLNQWIERIGAFLGIEPDDVGMIGSGKKRIGERITVALVQSLVKCAGDVAPHVGALVVDECHRTPSRTLTEAVSAFDSRYMLGLSATPWRRDRLSRLIFWYLGDVVYEVDRNGLVEQGHLVPVEVVQRETGFETLKDASEQYQAVLSELTEDPARNQQIVDDVARETRTGSGICLVLSDRKAHAETLREMFRDRGVKAAVLHGGLTARERGRVVDVLRAGKIRVLVATGQLIGEGFDLPALETLVLATPIKFSGRVLQYVGRVLRPAKGKDKATVLDYVDARVGVLAAAESRRRTFQGVQIGPLSGDSAAGNSLVWVKGKSPV